jgi:hypothetical protein
MGAIIRMRRPALNALYEAETLSENPSALSMVSDEVHLSSDLKRKRKRAGRTCLRKNTSRSVTPPGNRSLGS